MRHLVLTIIAIVIAGVAAVAATTAMLNAPMRIGPATGSTPTPAQPGRLERHTRRAAAERRRASAFHARGCRAHER